MGKYYAVHEIVWQPGDVLTAEVRFAPLWFFENRTGRLRFLPFVGAADGQELEPGGWMVTKGDGLMEACSVAWMFKHLPLRDWLVYSEKFGIPPVIGRTAGSPESEAGKGMARAVAGYGNESGSVIYGDDGTGKIEVMEAGKNSAALPFPGLIERMDRAICALWRGSDLGQLVVLHGDVPELGGERARRPRYHRRRRHLLRRVKQKAQRAEKKSWERVRKRERAFA